LVNYLLRPGSPLASPGRMQTPALPKSARAPRFSQLSEQWTPDFGGFEGTTLNIVSLLAPVAALAVWWMLWRTRFGFALRAVGKNPEAARAAGIPPRRMIMLTMALSGALAGLAGLEFVLGHKGYFEEGFSGGIGFLGIAVALLASNHPIGVLFTAFLFGVLSYSAVAIPTEFDKYIKAGILPEGSLVPPKDIIDIMQAAIILSVVLGNKVFDQIALTWKKRSLGRKQNLVSA
jgi:general nucleoside transport system permease protein